MTYCKTRDVWFEVFKTLVTLHLNHICGHILENCHFWHNSKVNHNRNALVKNGCLAKKLCKFFLAL